MTIAERENLKIRIKEGVDCKNFLEKSKYGMYICPFCRSGEGKHKTGALKVYDTNTYTCFNGSCGVSGDVLDLIQKINNCDLNEALEIGAKLLNDPAVNKPTAAGTTKEPEEREERDYTSYYAECRKRLDDPAVISYLTARGILNEARRHNLGYDPNWISPEAIRKAEKEGKDWRPDPSRRLIMPVSKSYYIARAIDETVKKQYIKMNEGSPEIFNKQVIHSEGIVFVAEALIDALSLESVGAIAIALNSTTNCKKLIKEIKEKGCKAFLIISLDNDKEGKTAAKELSEELKQLNIAHKIINVCGSYKDANEALTGDKKALQERVEEATQHTLSLMADQTQNKAPAADIQDDIELFFSKIQTEAYKPLKTGISLLDAALGGGILKQTLTTVSGAPGMGKTAFCTMVAEALAKNNKQDIVYYNLEMSKEQMIARTISRYTEREGGIPLAVVDILRGYNWTEPQRNAVKRTIEYYKAELQPYITFNPIQDNNIESILEDARKRAESNKEQGKTAPILIVDYLQIVATEEKDIAEGIKYIFTVLKRYAIQYDTSVIVVTATNRESNKRGSVELESGRDTSNIEYSADLAIGLSYTAIEFKEQFENNDGKKVNYTLDDIRELKRNAYINGRETPEVCNRITVKILKNRFVDSERTANFIFNGKQATFTQSDNYFGEWHNSKKDNRLLDRW